MVKYIILLYFHASFLQKYKKYKNIKLKNLAEYFYHEILNNK